LGQQAELQPEDFPLPTGAFQASSLSKGLSIEELTAQLPEQLDLRDTLAQLERSLMARAINLSGGVQAEAARRLGLSRSDFGYKAGKYSISTGKDRESM
jgi:transcriptional regulator with GAF, ATPase, and Fis domain